MGFWYPLWPHPRAHYVQRVHLVTLAIQVVPILGLHALLPSPIAWGVAGALWLVTVSRLHLLVHDRPRSRWVVRGIDEPVFLHWGACAFGLVVLPLASAGVALLGWIGVVGQGARWAELVGVVPVLALSSYLLALPVSAWSLWGIRSRLQIRQVAVPLRGLPPELDGYRIVHLSDLHIGSFEPGARARGWAKRANQLDADLCVVTGDLLTSGRAYQDAAAEVVGMLRARDGVFGCLGNHDAAADDAFAERLRAAGVCVLRNGWRCVRRGTARLVVAGLDDCYAGKPDLELTLAGRPADVPTVLLVHDPAEAAAAIDRRVELVLSGHTHGGQIGVPGLGDRINLTLLMGQPRTGLRRRSHSWHFVTAGLGTTGPPLRLAVMPEIALLVLRADGH